VVFLSLIVTTAEQGDIAGMLELNYKIYPKEWHVSTDYVHNIMKINKEVYRVVKQGELVKGIYSLFPLEKSIYEKVLAGQIEEGQLDNYLLNYMAPKDVFLYFISFIVDIYDQNKKAYTKALLKDMRDRLNGFEAKGIKIMEVGAIAISEDGQRILRRIGFQLVDRVSIEGEMYDILRASKDDIIKAIKT
jgi:hypothetical protein